MSNQENEIRHAIQLESEWDLQFTYIIYVPCHWIDMAYLMNGLPFSFETERMDNNVRLSAIGIGLGMDLLHLY